MNSPSWCKKVHHLNKWKARGFILQAAKCCPANNTARANQQSLSITLANSFNSSTFPSLKLTLLASFRPSNSASLSKLRRARSSFPELPMEEISNANFMDVKEPALKKQACDAAYTNGGALVAPFLALRVKKLAPEAVLPTRGSALAAGYDLSSAYDAMVPARGKALVKTELSVAIPEGTYGRVAPRSGLAMKHFIDVGAGVIDADYRGPLGVILFNHSDVDFTIKAGDRIAQLILERIVTPEVVEVDDLDSTVRGEGGFGSTGVAVTPVVVVEAPSS